MIMESKNNVQKQRMIQPTSREHQIKELSSPTPTSNTLNNANRKSSEKDVHKPTGVGGGGGGGVGTANANTGSSTITDEDRRVLKKVY